MGQPEKKVAAAAPVAAVGTAATGLKPGTLVQPVAPVVAVPVSSKPIIKEKLVDVTKVEDVTKPLEVPVTKPLTVERVVEVEKVVERKVPVEVEKVVYVDKPVEVIKEVPVIKEVCCRVQRGLPELVAQSGWARADHPHPSSQHSLERKRANRYGWLCCFFLLCPLLQCPTALRRLSRRWRRWLSWTSRWRSSALCRFPLSLRRRYVVVVRRKFGVYRVGTFGSCLSVKQSLPGHLIALPLYARCSDSVCIVSFLLSTFSSPVLYSTVLAYDLDRCRLRGLSRSTLRCLWRSSRRCPS